MRYPDQQVCRPWPACASVYNTRFKRFSVTLALFTKRRAQQVGLCVAAMVSTAFTVGFRSGEIRTLDTSYLASSPAAHKSCSLTVCLHTNR